MTTARKLIACALVFSMAPIAAAQIQPHPGVTVGLADGEGSPGERDVLVEFTLTNKMTVAGVQLRFEYDPDILNPVPDTEAGFPYVKFELGEHSGNFDTNGIMWIVSNVDGELRMTFAPWFDSWAEIPPGSGVLIRVLFKIEANAPIGETAMNPVDVWWWLNQVSDVWGNPIYPILEDGSVNVVPYLPGDVDNDDDVDEDDVDYLIAYIFQGGPPPNPINSGDVDQSCQIDIGDVVDLVDYVYNGDPGPLLEGCVEGDQ